LLTLTGVSGADVVERFLTAMVTHDWDAMGACLVDDVVRVGPYLDTYRGRDDYVAFIAGLLPNLPGYSMDLARTIESGQVVTALLAETVDGVRTPEALVFDLADDGRIARIEVFIQTGPS
jgi:limonene-1,2-epoxide hydrolase